MNKTPNRGKLIVHIGPPKTGTTSLQYYLQALERNDIYYCGVFQPRTTNDSIAYEVYRYCNESSDNHSKVEELKERISKRLNEFEYVVISEEGLVLETSKSTWQEKIIRLNNLLSSYAPSILFFTRDIVSALPSYYQEVYKALPPELQVDFALFERSNYALVYDYKSLHQALIEYGYTNIRWLQFESLVKGKYSLSDILGVQALENDERIILGQQNKSRIKNDARVLEKKHYLETYFEKFRILVPKRLRGKGLAFPLIRLLRASTKEEKKIEVSTFTKSHYKESLQYLKDIRE